MKKPSIVESRLFRNVSPHITSISKAQLFTALKRVLYDKRNPNNLDLDARDLSDSMSFSSTPQGAIFWQVLHREYTAGLIRGEFDTEVTEEEEEEHE
jgi:hypothetical protein